MKTITKLLGVILSICYAGFATPAWTEIQNHQLLAKQLLGEDNAARARALERTKVVLAELRSALILAMEREAEYESNRHAASMRGERLDSH